MIVARSGSVDKTALSVPKDDPRSMWVEIRVMMGLFFPMEPKHKRMMRI
jgi:hypothetical protein